MVWIMNGLTNEEARIVEGNRTCQGFCVLAVTLENGTLTIKGRAKK